MNSTHERVVTEVLGRIADGAPPAPEPESLGAPSVSGPSGPSGRWAWVAAAAAAVLALGAVIWLAVPSGEQSVAAPESVTMPELRQAVLAAVEGLAAVPNVEGVEHSYIDGHLASRGWFRRLENGDAVRVQTSDVDVMDTAWWIFAEEPPAVGERLATTAQVLVDGVAYDAIPGTGDQPVWSAGDPGGRGPVSFGLMYVRGPNDLLEQQLDLEGAEAARQARPEGGATWTVTGHPDGGGTYRGVFEIHPDGYLSAVTSKSDGMETNPLAEVPPVGEARITYRVLDDPGPIPTPEPGTPLDPSMFDLPPDFPTGSG